MMLQKKSSVMSMDPLIIPRVKQYLEENVHQTYVDVGVMARELQERYREYTRRKIGPFRVLVEQAYKTVLHSYGLDSNPSSDNDDEANSDLEVMNEGTTAPIGNDGEAIDISSDDDDSPSRHRNDGHTAVDNANIITTQIKSNKHITVTRVIRTDKPRNVDDETVESSNGSAASNGQRSAVEVNVRLPKKRRYEELTKTRQQQSIEQTLNNNPQLQVTVANVMPKSAQTTAAVKATTSKDSGTGPPAPYRTKRFRKEVVSRRIETCFDDVGGMDKILKNLCELLLHVKHPEIYRHIGLPPPRGFLLHGPPGSGKTLLAYAIAGQLKLGLIEVPATELVAGVSGESEERIRDVFEQAAALSPCVLFIDEIDSISANRVNAQKDMERRIVAQLLSSLDSLNKLDDGDGVIVIGATNRPDALDPALRRVGRFDQEISLGIPDRVARAQILRIICRKLKIDESIDYDELAKLTPGYVGADLLALATRAANTAVKRLLTDREKLLTLAGDGESMLDGDDDVMEVPTTVPCRKREEPTANGIGAPDDSVVALEDDEVVNLDDEKDEPKPAQLKVDDEPTSTATDEAVQEGKVGGDIPDGGDTKQTADDNDVQVAQEEKEAANKEAPDSGHAQKPVSEEVSASESSPTVANSETEKTESVAVPVDAPEKIANEADAMEVEPVATEATPSEEPSAPVELPDTEIKTEEVAEPATKAPGPKIVTPEPTLSLEKLMSLLLDQQNTLIDGELEGLCIKREDFLESLKTVQPSAKREGFITVPDVTWNDIGSLGDIREELKLAILAPVKFPQRLKALGLSAPSGVLLCGPPGCGKTLLAKAVANEAGINFISVKGPELLNMYVGESERAVRQCFQRARNSAPCVIFFDEFDSLCPKRSDGAEGGSGMRVVNQLLTEMDGIEERNGVFLMAATNRPDIVDPAVLRPGRLDKILYVGLPAEDDRVDILRALTKNRTRPPLADDVDLAVVARLTAGYTGADLAGLVRQASLHTLKDSIAIDCSEDSAAGGHEVQLLVKQTHFEVAIRNIKPSVNEEDKKHYEWLRKKYGAPVGLQ